MMFCSEEGISMKKHKGINIGGIRMLKTKFGIESISTLCKAKGKID